jgi:hypothetical protein
MNRRKILQVGSVAPLAGAGALAQISTAPEWKPELFTHANETVVVLTELIIPATDTPGAKRRW